MSKEIQNNDVKALLRFIVAGYFFDLLTKDEPCCTVQSLNISTKDKEVLKMVADGMSDDEIASKLVMSTVTIKNKIEEIFAKLENKERTKAASFALQNQMFAF